MVTASLEEQRRLLDVQSLDTRLGQLAYRRSHLPESDNVAQAAARLADVEQAAVTSRTALADLQREVDRADDDVTKVRERVQRNEQRLGDGSATPREVQALTSELELLAKRANDLEEIELQVMERVEQHESALGMLEASEAAMRAEHDEAVAAETRELSAIAEEEQSTADERATLAATLPKDLLALYERIREQLGGVGAAVLRGSRCEGCRLELNPSDLAAVKAAAADAVVRCEECGRILVRAIEG